ncbi:chromosome segregation protein SMC [Acididesulfobacillus acetoxydans]|uniref:Chromosome partition protein Smc n=1 Tax=Acididesulfobacillus acetoxydans TaxID=1561005 RepID=A0A8S0WHI2_9FIRM|nr:chromosome segregation protein SMC [Acididesulfobacillus acetoxydans]CAA7602722.1 chromosome segregation protein SMC [Acididesulfobacillus acetoxydans]CEJ06421.1 Chromosome partition protein Smc [Acididesulfobacillus acetoxydans]
MTEAVNLPVFLKSITIQGFKSFADRVRFDLQHGLSVIVGPNGSGKSNVADAVRWVLGEQSAKSLRGSRMEDIIFAGSSGRRSVGMAEVSLTFDNSSGIFPLEFQEVCVTRRVFRDGEGQFFINHSPCRLRDLQELFLDTGAGKEGFSIIGQGRVEEILNAKPEERRLILEEAAGVAKYRVRKREALKRLDDTERNLERLSDILREIEERLEPLSHQAEVARRGLALQTELHTLEIQAIVRDLAEVRRKLTASQEEEASLRLTRAEAEAELAQAEGCSQELKLGEKQLEEAVQLQHNEVFRAEQACAALENRLNVLRERYDNLAEQTQRLAGEVRQGQTLEQENRLKVEALVGKQALLRRTVQEASKEGAVREEALDRARTKNGLDVLDKTKDELFAALSEQAACSNRLTGVRHTLDSLEQQQASLAKAESGYLERVQTVRGELEEVQSRRQGSDEEEARLSREENRLREAFVEAEAEFRSAERALAELRGRKERLKAKQHALVSLADSLEGYARGVRELLAAKKRGNPVCRGLCGTVADLIAVEEKYELALETALGGAQQDIVTVDLEAAKRAIAFLKAERAGWATFLPLDTVRGGCLATSSVAADPGFIGLAVDLVRFEERYRPAMTNLLGRTLIVVDMEAAGRVAAAAGYKARVVTVEGDQIHPGGTLTGGSRQRKGSNFLGRSRELGLLAEELAQLAREEEEKSRDLQRLAEEKTGLELKLKDLSEKRRSLQEEKAVLAANRGTLEVQLKRWSEELEIARQNLIGIRAQKEEAGQALSAALSAVSAGEERVSGLRRELRQEEARAQAAAGEAERLTEALTEAKVQMAKWEEELRQTAVQLAEEKARASEQARALREEEARLARMEESLAAVLGESENVSQTLVQAQEGRSEKQLRLVQLREERERLSARSAKAEERTRASRKHLMALEQRQHNLELAATRWQTEWQGGSVRLADEFALSWPEALAYETEMARAEIQERIKVRRAELEALGPINQAAVTEYPALAERREFLRAQEEDLLEAGGKLRRLISELDETMSLRFKEGFEAVNAAFGRAFQELFSGGRAELRLVEPDNLLETGVEIIAQPPGKKLQWLSLLSGGERALTAIALLFGLLHVKPSPFCLLDEIEASLDDANVQRFAGYIRKLSASTQFIVISHRKGTMEAADVLYGIAMEESGVSKLLTVRMDAGEEDPVSA